MRTVRRVALLAVFALVLPTGALAATAGQPFPSNLYTTEDGSQATGLRVDLAKPNCAVRPSDCADIDVLNTLDGFNIQPRISVPFSGPIDLATATSDNIFLVGPGYHVTGINQVVWQPATNTLHFESDQQLDQSATYLLVVTNGVRGADGEPLDTTTFRHDLNFGQTNDPATKAYRKSLLDGLSMARAVGVRSGDIAAASLFTTQTITAISKKIRAQIQASMPGPVSFTLGNAGERTVFPLSPSMSMQWVRQIGTSTFAPPATLSLAALSVFSGSIASVAFGSYASPDYENASKVIPAYGTATGTPAPFLTNTIGLTLFTPSGTKPAGGWPVAIFGHGFGDSRNGAPWVVASSLAHAGVATVAINVVGHGFGPLGSYVVTTPSGTVTLNAGGRAIDQNGNGTFDSTEGVNAAAPQTLIGNRDGLRQTVVDIMQLVRQLQAGVDVDGDGASDLSRSRLYYGGQSFGGIYGTPLLGVEPALRAGLVNVPGGPIIEIARLAPVFRPLVGIPLFFRMPSIYNVLPPNPTFTNFNENIPLRNLPLLVDTVPGASAIQQVIEWTEWAQQSANPAAYAPHLTSPIILQFARGDQTVPNPTTSAIIRAGGLALRSTVFRNDLAFAANPAVPKNPHGFITNIASPSAGAYALMAQAQMATFFATDGGTTIDPDGAGPYFETPTSTVWEDLAFIP